MKTLAVIYVLAFTTSAFAGQVDLNKDIDSLGQDQAVIQRAKALDPKNQVKIVQKRAVDRRSRFEISVDGGLVGGGDSYVNSQIFGGTLGFHFTPSFSVAVRYSSYINNLTAEGKAYYDSVANYVATAGSGNYVGGGARPPAVDSPLDTTMFLVNWYPIYGKMNIDGWIPHFDVYLLAGYGKTNTEHNSMSDTVTAGGGIGLWLSNTFTFRIEARYQTYNDKPYYLSLTNPDETRKLDTFIGQASIGILL